MAEKITAQDTSKQKKQIQQIMKVNNENYQEWLYNKHQEYLANNTDVISKALEFYHEKQNNNQTNLRGEEHV